MTIPKKPKKTTRSGLPQEEVGRIIKEARDLRGLGDMMCQYILLASDKATWNEAHALTTQAGAAAQEWKGRRNG